jgi:hypothetical protein
MIESDKVTSQLIKTQLQFFGVKVLPTHSLAELESFVCPPDVKLFIFFEQNTIENKKK